jgi:hypothetical protein
MCTTGPLLHLHTELLCECLPDTPSRYCKHHAAYRVLAFLSRERSRYECGAMSCTLYEQEVCVLTVVLPLLCCFRQQPTNRDAFDCKRVDTHSYRQHQVQPNVLHLLNHHNPQKDQRGRLGVRSGCVGHVVSQHSVLNMRQLPRHQTNWPHHLQGHSHNLHYITSLPNSFARLQAYRQQHRDERLGPQ